MKKKEFKNYRMPSLKSKTGSVDTIVGKSNENMIEIHKQEEFQNFSGEYKRKSFRIVFLYAICLALLINLSFSYYTLNKQNEILKSDLLTANNKYLDLVENPEKISQLEAESLKKKVAEIITLPENEIPTIATVTDKSLLKDQPFFANSEVGDKVLYFKSSAKAILYRPSTGKIVEMINSN